MKYAGALLLSISVIFISCYVSEIIKKRNKALAECVALVRYISSEISYADEPVNKIIYKASQNEDFNLLNFLQDSSLIDLSSSFAQAWCESIDKNNNELYFGSDINSLLKGFGRKLGKTDVSGQKELCSYYENQFAQLHDLSSTSQHEKIKLCHTVGFAIGALLFVFVI